MDEVAVRAPRLEHVFDVRINFDKRWQFGPLPGGGNQGYTSVLSGTVRGPKLQGRLVEHSGADYATVRADGVVELNAHYLLEADDGTRIYIRNQGYVHGPLPAREDGSDDVAIPRQFVCTPYFRAPVGPHDWLNRTVIVGRGVRQPAATDDQDHSVIYYWAVH